jgi:hypothetical protein
MSILPSAQTVPAELLALGAALLAVALSLALLPA